MLSTSWMGVLEKRQNPSKTITIFPEKNNDFRILGYECIREWIWHECTRLQNFDYVTRHQAMKRRGNFPYSSCVYNVPLSCTTSLLWCCYHDLLSGPEGYQGGTLASPTSRCINKHGWKWLQYLQNNQCLVVQCILQRKCYLGVEPANITRYFTSCVINVLEMVWENWITRRTS